MEGTERRWLDAILSENERFTKRIAPDALPVQRTPGSTAVITCMDPRINLESMGIPGFTEQGGTDSAVRVIRTIGGMAEPRSLVVGIFLAGIREIAVVMHTDCGCSLAHARIDAIIESMNDMVPEPRMQAFKAAVGGEPFRENLMKWLKTFEEPREAVKREIAAIKALPFLPDGMILHGLVYDLATGGIEVVVNGYA